MSRDPLEQASLHNVSRGGLATCCMLWVGTELGFVERACIASVVRQGHPVSLYCYQRPRGLPAGVVLRDAGQILPRHALIRHARGDLALFSERFRYEIQRRGLCIWMDCDIYLLSPLFFDDSFVAGRGPAGRVLGSVLRIPQESPMLAELLTLFEEKTVPDWLPWPSRAAAEWRRLTTGRTGIAKMPRGAAGTMALTRLAEAHDLSGQVHSTHIFYPVAEEHASWVLDPSQRLEDNVSVDTVALHLWTSRIRAHTHSPAPENSFLARLQAEGADT